MALFVVLFAILVACRLQHVDALDWPDDQALPSFPDVYNTIDVADITPLSGEEQGLLTTLQGVVNRKRPRIYLYWNKTGDDPEGVNQSHQTWLQGIAEHVELHDYSGSPLQLLQKYRSDISGAIVYDPNVTDTINLATTLAGLHDSVVANAQLANAHDLPIVRDLRGMFKNKLEVYEYGLNNVYVLATNRLITAIRPEDTTQDKTAQWTTIEKAANDTLDGHDSGNVTKVVDLTEIASKVSFGGTIYVRIKDACEKDGAGPTLFHMLATAGPDNTTIADFVPGTSAEDAFLADWGGSSLRDYPWGSRSANGKAYMVYGFQIPNGTTTFTLELMLRGQYEIAATTDVPATYSLNAVFRDYIVATKAPCIWLDPNNKDEVPLLQKILSSFEPNSAYMGWFPNGDEMSGVTQTAQKSLYVVAADNLFNASLMSGLRKLFSISSKRLREKKAPSEIHASSSSYAPAPSKPEIRNKIYISLTWTEGDNLQYMQHRMISLWSDALRGTIPMSWTINPLIIDIAPNILNYFQTTATENDTFVLGPSGAGYTFPINWPRKDLEVFLNQTKRYAEMTGTLERGNIWVYNRVNSTLYPLNSEIVSAYQNALGDDDGILGISADTARGAQNPYAINITTTSHWSAFSGDGRTPGAVPVAGLATISSVEQGLARLKNISRDFWEDKNEPLFVNCALYAWDMTPGNVSVLVDRLSDEFEVVSVESLFSMVREYHNVTTTPKT